MKVEIPPPLPDELLYSAITRGGRRLGLGTASINFVLFERELQNISLTFGPPSGADLLSIAQGAGWSIQQESLLKEHTLMRLVTPLLPEAVKSCYQARPETSFLNNQLKRNCGKFTGITRFSLLRFCTECRAADLKRHGEAYWHRIHQIPSLKLCAIHKASLWESEVRLMYPVRYVALDDVVIAHQIQLPEEAVAFQLRLAPKFLEILGADLPPIIPEAFREAYCRLVSGKDRQNPETPSLTADLRHTFGVHALNSLEPGYADRLKPQMSKLLKSKRQAPMSIQEYALLSIRMGRTLAGAIGYADSLPRPIWPCMNKHCESRGKHVIESKRFKGYPTRWEFRCPHCSSIYSRPDPLKERPNGEFAFEFVSDPPTFAAQRDDRRAEYLRLRTQPSLTKAEKNALIYNQDLLGRWDFDWFNPVRVTRRNPPLAKRKWAPRDEEWLHAAKLFLPDYVFTTASTGRRPIKAFQLIRALEHRRSKKFPWCSRGHFPLTMQFVRGHVEDRATFVRRKLSLGRDWICDVSERPSWTSFLLHYGFDKRWLQSGDKEILETEYYSLFGFPSCLATIGE